MQKLPPRIREALEFLLANAPAVSWAKIPEHLRGPVCRCETRKPKWARTIGIDGVPHVELLAAGAAALEADRDWDKPAVRLSAKLGSPPTRLQKNIWKALERRALKKDDLLDALGYPIDDPARLYYMNRKTKTGGLKELTEKGLVANKRGVGYFRPDAPPDN